MSGKLAEPTSVMLKNNSRKAALRAPKQYDYKKALIMRNTGIGLMAGGVAMAAIIGLPCIFATEDYGSYGREPNDAANIAGYVFFGTGLGVAIYAGIPVLCVGQVQLDKARKMDITLNAGSNGVGVGLTF